MVMRGLALLFIVTCTLLCTSIESVAQGREQVLAIEGITRVTHLSSSGANLYLRVRNNSRHTIVAKRGEIDIMVDGNVKSTISLRDKVVVAKGHEGEILLPLRFRSTSALTLQSLLRRIAEGESQNISVTYRLRGGTRLIKRNFRGEDIAISEFLDTFAIPQGAITRLEEVLR